ncbi:AMIN domain-containing protein [Oscillatoria sp. FACHB-1407]|uniref:AMIN domain-containing protein n=1 Tax=Oscillatoria sp. FACHB-1407 TaxID=2692847 RepID=UPI0016883C60|nr:AMIN domain-containing protein [Oscillatoria sp. FACHB-1407]MBD2463720.1 AMIN domain-containing protein [Oscillatoria sp. FACHB-1407]
MRLNGASTHLLIAGLVGLGGIQAAQASETHITAVQLNPVSDGLELILDTTTADPTEPHAISDEPEILETDENQWVVDLPNSRLTLTNGNGFLQSNPAPGISSVMVNQYDRDRVRITVTGTTTAPIGAIAQHTGENLALTIASTVTRTNTSPSAATPLRTAQIPPAPEVLVPNPTIQIEGDLPGRPTPQQVPLQPRAIAPPLGDIAISNVDASPSLVNLGTSELVPRLVLREARVRDVLALLARAAGLNLAYDETPIEPGTGQGQENATNAEPTISLDIENEPIQDVFNYVLQLTGLEANRRGRTIFVSNRLPNAARNLSVRSLRLNQVQVGVALNFLVGMGAESAVSRERLVTSVNAVPVQLPQDGAAPLPPAVTQTQTTTEERIETQRVDYEDTTPPLRGLLVLGDERTNTLTLIGTPRQIELATSGLVQLDVRRRQVAVNVQIVDVNLSAIETIGASFSFGIGDVFFRGLEPANIDGAASVNINDFTDNVTSNAFTALLEAEITSGNAKILTDPTLIVQEGQRATVALTQEVQTSTGTTTFDDEGNVVSFDQDDPRAAGLTLVIEVSRIDDNGFVTLSVAPTVTAPTEQQTNPDDSVTTLLSSRSLESGQIRLRDGQTLILTGIIQDSDRVTVSKVPILGDIPLLGALFRSTNRQNERREVIVLLTPQVINDSDQSTFGYSYIPSNATQQVLQQYSR